VFVNGLLLVLYGLFAVVCSWARAFPTHATLPGDVPEALPLTLPPARRDSAISDAGSTGSTVCAGGAVPVARAPGGDRDSDDGAGSPSV
jgi:hypothetical protein